MDGSFVFREWVSSVGMEKESSMRKKTLNPAKLVVCSFLAAIAIGTGLLCLPASSTGDPLTFVDALFTATSAVCVTGLSVIDIGSRLSFFGQTVVLGLIQTGGLGIMTFSVFFMLLFRRQVTLNSRMSVGIEPHQNDTRNLLRVLSGVFLMVIVFEAIGTGLIYLRFRHLSDVTQPVFYSVFHAISAFCNAGFSLFPDSLTRFQNESYIPVVIMGLIVAGGLGFILIDEIRRYVKARCQRQKFRLSLHTKICLTGTLILIVTGGWMIWFLEGKNLLLGAGHSGQMINSFFLSITSRTAGFNMLDTGSLTNATLFFISMLMFIGGCPGSAAGGIKVSTFAILLAVIKCQIQGQASTSVMGRKIPKDTVARSIAVFAAGFVLICCVTLFFQITEKTGVSHLSSKGSFLDFLFEAVSAFGTVGLSTGVTSSLSSAGKILTILLMLAGRVGPITAGLAFMTRSREPSFEYVEEDVVIG